MVCFPGRVIGSEGCGGGRWWRDSAGVVGDVCDGNPWVCSHGTHTHERRYSFTWVWVQVDPNLPMGYP